MEPILCAHGNPAVRFVVPEPSQDDPRLTYSEACQDCAALLECDVTMLELRSVLDGE